MDSPGSIAGNPVKLISLSRIGFFNCDHVAAGKFSTPLNIFR
jgi:hypothetical protein